MHFSEELLKKKEIFFEYIHLWFLNTINCVFNLDRILKYKPINNILTKIMSISLCKQSPSAHPTNYIMNRESQSHFPLKKLLKKNLPSSRNLFSQQFFIWKCLCDSRFKIWCVGWAKGDRLHREMDIILIGNTFLARRQYILMWIVNTIFSLSLTQQATLLFLCSPIVILFYSKDVTLSEKGLQTVRKLCM